MTMEPHVDGVQDAGVTGAVGAAGVEADVDEFDMPPPQALRAAIAKVHAAAVNHRRGIAHARVARCEHCIEISSLCLVLPMSAGAQAWSYFRKRRGMATNAGNRGLF
jgi:hypothetical protein